jgi:hypothetical protein
MIRGVARDMLNRNILIALFAVIALLAGGYFIWRAASGQNSSEVQSGEIVKTSSHQAANSPLQNIQPEADPGTVQKSETIAVKNNDIPVSWKTYSNTRLGFTFRYPATWYQNGKDADVINLSGVKTEVDISFTDSASKSSLFIAYHLAPEGAKFYNDISNQYHASQGRFASGSAQIQIAGKNAFQSATVVNRDGKGHELNPSLKLVIVDLPDYAQTGAVELQFKTPATNAETELNLFHQLLSGFKFIVK